MTWCAVGSARSAPIRTGQSALKRRAVRITYRPDNQVSKQEIGNVNGTTDPDWGSVRSG